jgi:CheY-like chemotaxis protein
MATSNTPIRVLTVDDHPLLREGIAAVLEGQQDMVLVAEATNGHEAIESFRAHRPDVTLMDLQMPEMSGIDAIIAIRREFAHARIVVLTTYSGDAPFGPEPPATFSKACFARNSWTQFALCMRASGESRPRSPPKSPSTTLMTLSRSARSKCCASSPPTRPTRSWRQSSPSRKRP